MVPVLRHTGRWSLVLGGGRGDAIAGYGAGGIGCGSGWPSGSEGSAVLRVSGNGGEYIQRGSPGVASRPLNVVGVGNAAVAHKHLSVVGWGGGELWEGSVLRAAAGGGRLLPRPRSGVRHVANVHSAVPITCASGPGAKLGTSELSEGILQLHQDLIRHVKLVFCHTVWSSTTRVETKLASVFVGTELSDAVVGPGSYLLSCHVLDGDGCSSEV